MTAVTLAEAERRINELRAFEDEYRTRLRAYLQGLLRDLDAISVPGTPASRLTPDHRVVLGQAIADAVAHREPGACADCAAEFGGLCYDHAGEAMRADAYLALARDLAIEVPS